MEEKNTNKIAKNTAMLYFRMLLTMVVSLYTVRVVLNTLGIADYGIYNVVGGIVTSFSFFSATMATASQRFFAYEIGRNDTLQLKRTFSVTLLIYCIIAFVILLLAETVGLWFLNNRMKIPADRMDAANWVYQFSILSFMVVMFQVPYDAIVIAREKMNVFAYLSILEVILKLLVIYLLVLLPYDKLKTYAILIFLITVIITTIYRHYCLKNFEESHFKFYWNKQLIKELTSYSGWNLFGALAGVFNNQGINIVLNLFFGPVVNAARAIAYQVNNAINGFVQNFMTAARPQITKYFAAGETQKMLNLVFRSAKFSFFLLFTISMPVLLGTHFIFKLWLKEIPEYVILFTRIIIITALINTLSYSLMAAFQATGKIKIYQAVIGSIIMLNVPMAYLFFKLDYAPESCLIIVLITSIICLFVRLYLLKRIVKEFAIGVFFKEVLLPVVLVSFFSAILPLYIKNSLPNNMTGFISMSIITVTSCLALVYSVGIDAEEKALAKGAFYKLKRKYIKI